MPCPLVLTASPHDTANTLALQALQAELGLAHVPEPAEDAGLVLTVQHDGLWLHATAQAPGVDDDLRGARPWQPDWSAIDTTSGAGRSKQTPLMKALGLHKRRGEGMRVIDATAGWGGDAWLLAAAGCSVVAIERHAAVAALLRDAQRRATATALAPAHRLAIRSGDAKAWLQDPTLWPDGPAEVICLDPMFPQARRSAPKKPMRLLHALLGELDEDARLREEGELLQAALGSGAKRVVVKRPVMTKQAAPLGGVEPALVFPGKGQRFEVYFP